MYGHSITLSYMHMYMHILYMYMQCVLEHQTVWHSIGIPAEKCPTHVDPASPDTLERKAIAMDLALVCRRAKNFKIMSQVFVLHNYYGNLITQTHVLTEL